MAVCDARIRPMAPVNSAEIACEGTGTHSTHRGTLRDYAYPGSVTTVQWDENDRRNFHGEWPGECLFPGCILPRDHRGKDAL